MTDKIVSSAFPLKKAVTTAVVDEDTEITGHKPLSPGNVCNPRQYVYSKSLVEEIADILKKQVIFCN